MTNIKIEISKLLKERYGIDPDVSIRMFDDGVLTYKACRDALIKQEYSKKIESKGKQRRKAKIADSYCISVKLVEKIVLNNS